MENTHSFAAFIGSEYFPRSSLYPPVACWPPAKIGEHKKRTALPFTERHLQCAWYDDRFRPRQLTTSEGEPVSVVHPGVWNLEAGPDFLGAMLEIGTSRRRIAGDLEVHIHPTDWSAHGHDRDARYEKVRFHLTYFPSIDTHQRPANCIHISLRHAYESDPRFSFEAIDLLQYPYASRPTPTPCSQALKQCNADEWGNLLDAAGEERLRRKAETIARTIEAKGPDQVLYEELMTGLGYKHNKAPFHRLAELIPMSELQATSQNRSQIAYALLMGVAGLLPEIMDSRWDDETRTYIRALWDIWWKHKEKWDGRILHRTDWRLANIRPTNNPTRRLMLAARLFTSGDSLVKRWGPPDAPEPFIQQVMKTFREDENDYWATRLSLSTPRAEKPAQLIGEARIASLLVNVVVPYLAAVKTEPAQVNALLKYLPPEEDNTVVRQTALALFGRDHAESLYRTGLRQQGLIQIFNDFCLNDRSRCETCPLPELMKKLE